MQNNLILVDEGDKQVGVDEKLSVHRSGKLDRAFSVFIFNSKGELMLQKRAKGKYHSGGLWSNTSCSHPLAGEDTEAAAHRRLKEEMGFDCALEKIGELIYRVGLDNGYIEHEYDQIYRGTHENAPELNREEGENWRWISEKNLAQRIKEEPEAYTYWLKSILKKMPGKIFPG